jgi:hypothetical protein
MYNPSDSSMDSGGSGAMASRNQRYTYLVGRLRTRQITMEEATELFSIQQAALTRAEAARLAALAQASAASASSSSAPLPPPPPRVGPAAGGSDDFLILGLLTMGAGAGLLAAMTQKLQQGAVAPTGTANKKPLPK